jgi:hypothetical protein
MEDMGKMEIILRCCTGEVSVLHCTGFNGEAEELGGGVRWSGVSCMYEDILFVLF